MRQIGAPTRAVVRISQSPLNEKRWCLDLDCGHEVWITRTRRPEAGFVKCSKCGTDEHEDEK